MMTKIYYRIKSKQYQFKDWFFENITPWLPKIPTRKPQFPSDATFCSLCHTDIKIYAYHTGDGWMFFWDCELQHISYIDGDCGMIIDWFPFLFGWATGKDMGRIGIEVV